MICEIVSEPVQTKTSNSIPMEFLKQYIMIQGVKGL